MIDKSSVKQSLMELADKVYPDDAGGAVRLRLLADAVESGQNADTWTTIDIYKMIDVESIVQRFKSQQSRGKIVDGLELARNTLVLGPIIATWFGISQATAAYNAQLSDLLLTHPNQVSQPFLYLWGQQFGGRLPWFLTLSAIAGFDAALLLFIFLLTFVVYYLSQQNVNRIEQERQNLYAELVHALAGASLCLRSIHQQQALTSGDNLEVVARKIDSMTTQTTARLQTMVEQMVNQFNGMANQISNRFNGMADQIVDRFTAITQQMNKQLQEGHTYLSTMKTFAGGLQQLSQDMKGTAQAITNTNAQLLTSVNDLVVPTKELANQQRDLIAATKDSLTYQQGAVQSLTELGKKQDRWGADLTDVLDTLNLTVEKAAQLAASVGDFTKQQTAFLQSLENERNSQANLAKLTSDASVRVREALDDMQSGSKALRSIANDMYDVQNLQVGTNTSNILQSQVGAAQAIEKSGASLNASAIAIYQASQKLTDVVYELERRLAGVK